MVSRLQTGGFIGFIILMAIGEQMGMSAKAIGVAFVAFTIFIYALIGYLSRTAQADAYYVAGRQVPTVFNGMATAADWMSACRRSPNSESVNRSPCCSRIRAWDVLGAASLL